jgi:hypothetical protein
MKKLTVSVMVLVILLFIEGMDLEAATQSVTPSDYLIIQSIGSFLSDGKGKCGNGPGLHAAADHFRIDHNDITCDTGYYNVAQDMAVEIQVTQHAGVDSDKWLLHELDRDFRNYYGLPGDSYVMRVINGNTIMAAGSGGWDYRWLSGYKVVHISYTDLQMTKPEPLEVVQAYLAKFPSTLTSMTSADLRTAKNETTWIKDEMDRRLWLCDKWFYQLQLSKVQQGEVLQQAVKSLNIFLDYREKYYGIKAANEKNLLASYLNTNNGTGIKTKLAEYKTWWTVNKEKGISL